MMLLRLIAIAPLLVSLTVAQSVSAAPAVHDHNAAKGFLADNGRPRTIPGHCNFAEGIVQIDAVAWRVFACADQRAMILIAGVTGSGEPCYVFIVREDGVYKMLADGHDQPAPIAASITRISRWTDEDILAVYAQVTG